MGEQNQMTVIGPDTHIKGEMTFNSGARILGRFDGQIDAQGEVEIGETAKCAATIRAQRVVIDGELNGDAIAEERVQLNARANVTGDLTATTLVVAEGASFRGQCNVGPNALSNATPIGTKTTTPKASQPWDRPAPTISTSPTNGLKAGFAALRTATTSVDTTEDEPAETRASA